MIGGINCSQWMEEVFAGKHVIQAAGPAHIAIRSHIGLVALAVLIALLSAPSLVVAQVPGPPPGTGLGGPEIDLNEDEPTPVTSEQLSGSAEGWEGVTIAEISVRGNRRVEADTILDRIRIEPGDEISRSGLSADLRRIHRLGFFDEIEVRGERTAQGQARLIFVVEEKPAIDAIEFVGNDTLSEDDLREALRIRRFSILDTVRVVESAEAIRDLYREEGHFLAEVDHRVRLREGRPDLAVVTFDIREFAQVEVKRVTFVGNEALSSDELSGVMATRPGNLLSFMTEMGTFREDRFEEDLQRLTAFYYNHGYVQVQVEMPAVRLSRDKRHLYITIRVEEGPQHFVGDVGVRGDLLTEPEELMAMTSLGDDEVFRYGALQEDMMALTRFYQDAGYANVRINPLTRIHPDSHRVDVDFDIVRGERVRIGRIEIVGNMITRDEVIRRELVIEEGDWYSASTIERSQMRVRRLGFFESVDMSTQQTEDPGLIDLQLRVAERPTGTFQLGAGLSSQENFIFQGQVAQQNLFGRGQALELSVMTSSIRTLFNLRFSEPWLLGSRWRFAMDLYNFDFLYQEFGRRSLGGTLSFGYPIGDLLGLAVGDALSASVRYKLEDVTVTPGGILGTQAPSGSPLFEGGLTSSIRLGLRYDSRDDALFPTSGMYHSASAELADSTWTLSGNEFLKVDGDARAFFPLFWNFVLRMNVSAGWVASTNSEKPVPIFERYFVGGPETVRGFDRFSLGPVQRVPGTTDDPAGGLESFRRGGNKKLIFTTEIEFPIFAAAQLRGVLFADMGNAFDQGDPFSLRPDLLADDEMRYADALRTSVGFGVRWFSPIGPLRFEWGIPLQRLPGERPLVFDFSITNAF